MRVGHAGHQDGDQQWTKKREREGFKRQWVTSGLRDWLKDVENTGYDGILSSIGSNTLKM